MSAKSLLLCRENDSRIRTWTSLGGGGKHYPVNLHKAYTVLYLEIAQKTATDTLKPEVRGWGDRENVRLTKNNYH